MQISSALQAAQQRLTTLRLRHQQQKVRDRAAEPTHSRPAYLPSHLGWHTPHLTTVLRRERPTSATGDQHERPQPSRPEIIASDSRRTPERSQTIVVQPEMATAILQSERTASARVWYLLRLIDVSGRGMVTIEEARRQLCSKDAPMRLCGWRQLRNLLRDGNDLFWQRDKHHIWLRSLTKVATALEVERFQLKPIELPVSALLEPIGTVRAQLYAAFHSGREPQPIARETLRQITGVSPSSQRQYEARLRIKSSPQYSVTTVASPHLLREALWRRGKAVFVLQDYQGRHGRPGSSYIARQLPNSYDRIHDQLSSRPNRRLNRRLRALKQIGTSGNVQRQRRRFCTDSGQAARTDGQAFYPSSHRAIWYTVCH